MRSSSRATAGACVAANEGGKVRLDSRGAYRGRREACFSRAAHGPALFEALREASYSGAYDTVRRFVKAWHRDRGRRLEALPTRFKRAGRS
jgi:hypothetical protein